MIPTLATSAILYPGLNRVLGQISGYPGSLPKEKILSHNNIQMIPIWITLGILDPGLGSDIRESGTVT